MSTTLNRAILGAAERHLGLEEWPGAKSNPAVEQLWATAGMEPVPDDVPWCAGFVGAVLGEVGLRGTGSRMAKSYLNWGEKVIMSQVIPGDIVVFHRGDPKGPFGHVGFVVRFEGNFVVCRGGNQNNNRVSDGRYPLSSVAGFRRADASAKADANQVRLLRVGVHSSEVGTLQKDLKALGYFNGKVDDKFGPLTEIAVIAFQKANDLKPDGIVGPVTRAALDKGIARPTRDVTVKDLKESGSVQVTNGSVIAGVGGVLGVTQVVEIVAKIDNAVAAIERATGPMEKMLRMMDQFFWPVVVLAGCGIVIYFGRKVVERRVWEARTGANLSR